MKKTVFAAQVFGLIAMLPMVVILEMNHVPNQQNRPSGKVSTTEKKVISWPEKITGKLCVETLSLVTFLFKTAW
jgi:hypothetical protein